MNEDITRRRIKPRRYWFNRSRNRLGHFISHTRGWGALHDDLLCFDKIHLKIPFSQNLKVNFNPTETDPNVQMGYNRANSYLRLLADSPHFVRHPRYRNTFSFSDTFLFSGTLKFKDSRSTSEHNSRQIELDLKLNPLRFVRHRILFDPEREQHFLDLDQIINLNPLEALTINPEVNEQETLDGSDNHVPYEIFHADNPLDFDYITRIYIENILTFIFGQLILACANDDYTNEDLEELERFCQRPLGDGWDAYLEIGNYRALIKYAEVCYEYNDDALSKINAMRKLYFPYFHTASCNEYSLRQGDVHFVQEARDFNLPTLKMRLLGDHVNPSARARKIEFVMYAKTVQRLRTEVRYSGSLWTLLQINENDYIEDQRNKHHRIFTMLDVAKEDAKNKLHILYENLPPLRQTAGDVETSGSELGNLLCALAQVTTDDNYNDLVDVMKVLLHNGGYSERRASDTTENIPTRYNAIINRLQSNGIVTQSHVYKKTTLNTRRYTLKPTYQSLISAILEIAQDENEDIN